MADPLAPLDRAFVALNNAGITAKHCHTCCPTCGHAEFANDEAYVFYHAQSAERVVEWRCRELCLHYNSNVNQLSSRIIAVLRQHGMVTSGGEPGMTVQVQLDDASKVFVADLYYKEADLLGSDTGSDTGSESEYPPFSEAFPIDLMSARLAQSFSD